MLLFLAVVFLGPVAAVHAAVAPLQDACNYLEDVRGTSRSACLSDSARIGDEVMREAVSGAPERRRQVEELARRLSAAASDRQITAVLFEFGTLVPPLNERTFPAWFAAENPLRLSGPTAEAVAFWISRQGTDRAERRLEGPAESVPASALSKRLSEIAQNADAAAAAMDGTRPRSKHDFPAPVDDQPAKTNRKKELAVSNSVKSFSDLSLAPPPAPSDMKKGKTDLPPLLSPGEDGPRESLSWSIDRKADPCADFYQFACGKWIGDHPLNGQSERTRFSELSYRNEAQLRVIVQKLASAPPPDPNERKLGDYFASCMDRNAIESSGLKPLQPDLSRIQDVADMKGLAKTIAHLHSPGLPALFGFGSERDRKNAQEVIASISQAGGGLPREYYLDRSHSKKLKAYADHVKKTFMLLEGDKRRAGLEAGAVLRLETALARITVPNEELRDPAATYHRMPLADFAALAPSFPWTEYLLELKAPPIIELNVSTPKYFEGLETLLAAAPLDDWKAYLRWRLLSATSQELPSAFSDEESNFSNILNGSKGRPQRWNSCLSEIDDAMGEALGQAYVEQHFDESAKKAMVQLAQTIKSVLKDDIEQASWMDPETKRHALEKAEAMTLKVGYPDHPKDYGGLKIVRGAAYGNARSAGAYGVQQNLARIGRPVDKSEWGMPAQAVNAYYSAQNNEIVFPAGILQPPFFDPQAGEAVNFGAIGTIVGHEMTHGFDDEGRRYDSAGNLHDWWTEKDSKSFQGLAQNFVKQYSAYPVVPGEKLPVNGELTLGENIADNGGLRLAYKAFQSAPGEKRGSDGFTPEQSFFLGYGRLSCGNETKESAQLWAATDPHPPKRVRVNASTSNMPEFQQAFNCKPGSPMVAREPARIW